MKNVCNAKTVPTAKFHTTNRNYFALLTPVRALRRELGLTPNDITVLSALISFLPREDQSGPKQTSERLTTVFPSNERLIERANGIDERTLRRCLSRLSEAGLIARKSSANGKRFPLRYNGVIRDAFGFDIQPLIDTEATLLARAAETAQENERLKSLRAEALALRAHALELGNLMNDEVSELNGMRTVLRRTTLTVEMVMKIIRKLKSMFRTRDNGTSHKQPERITAKDIATSKMTGTNGQNDRHIESSKIDLSTRKEERERTQKQIQHKLPNPLNHDPSTMEWQDLREISKLYSEPNNSEQVRRIIFEIGSMIRINHDKLMQGLRSKGPGKMLLTLEYLLCRTDIRNHTKYFDRLVEA